MFFQRLSQRGYPRRFMHVLASRPRKCKVDRSHPCLKVPYHPRLATSEIRNHLRDLQCFGVHANITFALGRNNFLKGYMRNHRHLPGRA